MPEHRQGLEAQDPRYWRAGGAIWLVVGAATFALSVCYSNPWWLAIGVMLMGGGGLMLTRHYRLAQLLVYPMLCVGLAWVLIVHGWRDLLSRSIESGVLLLALWLVMRLRRKLTADSWQLWRNTCLNS